MSALPLDSKSPKAASTAETERRGKRDEGTALIVAVRLLQLLIIVVLWLLTAYFGRSCFDPSGIHQRSAGPRRSDRSIQRPMPLSTHV